MLSKNDVIDLYLQYGFEKENGNESEKYIVFFSQNGYFQNAEIVILDDSLDEKNINKQKYEEIGYSVRVKKYPDNDSITEKYLELLLTREKVRQDLPLSIDEQKVMKATTPPGRTLSRAFAKK